MPAAMFWRPATRNTGLKSLVAIVAIGSCEELEATPHAFHIFIRACGPPSAMAHSYLSAAIGSERMARRAGQ